ncbi:MAG: temperature dependent protein affecting M2 dsRNA replication-domain-containing protein [Benniella sp.]|nr:MAG: temperature dependent protein affecting M2 dsRNA replication-domain-containing protein [Benniella sp.]
MTISLSPWTAEYMTGKDLVSVRSLSMLKDHRIGIDGNVWLKKITQAASEQYQAGIGGIPSGMRKAIEKELEGFKAASIHPLFVFSGLALIRKEKPIINDDARILKRNTAWSAVNSGDMGLAMSSWSESYIHQPDLIHLVIRILKEHNIEYIRAPYSAGAQLVYLERNPKQIIHAIYAGTEGSELLMFEVDRVITSIDFAKQTFSYISKKEVLLDLVLSDDQFLDLCILAGGDHCTTFPPISVEGAFAFKSVHDLRQHVTGFNFIKAFADLPQTPKVNYGELFIRTRCAMRHHPVLTEEGRVEPMNAAHAPSDIHDFVGPRLPDEVYYYISRGVISDAVLNTLVCGYGAEYSPLCNGETNEYRHFLTTDIMKMKAQIFALLRAKLNPFYDRKIIFVHWYDSSSASAEHVIKTDTPLPVSVDAISNWKSGNQSIEKELKKANIASPNYSFALGLVATANDASATVVSKNTDKPTPLVTLAEVQTRHLSKLLQLRSFIESSHVPSPFGKAFINAFKAHPTAPAEFQDTLFIALELVRAELLTSRPTTPDYAKKPPVLEDETATKAIRLVSRTASLIGARFKGTKPWAGPLSRELLAFNSIGKLLKRNLRHLSEALILEMLLANECKKDTLEYTDLATQLPFAHEPSTVLGILVKEYLETLTLNAGTTTTNNNNNSNNNNSNNTFNHHNKDQAVQQVEEHIGVTSLTSLEDGVKAELQRGFAFWNVVADAVKSLSTSKAISKELAQEFQEADQWVKARKI